MIFILSFFIKKQDRNMTYKILTVLIARTLSCNSGKVNVTALRTDVPQSYACIWSACEFD